MELSNYVVSWVVTYLGDLQPTYIGVITQLLSTMDIQVIVFPRWVFSPGGFLGHLQVPRAQRVACRTGPQAESVLRWNQRKSLGPFRGGMDFPKKKNGKDSPIPIIGSIWDWYIFTCMNGWFLSAWWFQAIWKIINQHGNLPQVGVKAKNIWNHHPVEI